MTRAWDFCNEWLLCQRVQPIFDWMNADVGEALLGNKSALRPCILPTVRTAQIQPEE